MKTGEIYVRKNKNVIDLEKDDYFPIKIRLKQYLGKDIWTVEDLNDNAEEKPEWAHSIEWISSGEQILRYYIKVG